MTWSYYLAYFFAGAFLANGVPHFCRASAATSSRHHSPRRRVGESSAVVKVLWGLFNFAVGGGLLHCF